MTATRALLIVDDAFVATVETCARRRGCRSRCSTGNGETPAGMRGTEALIAEALAGGRRHALRRRPRRHLLHRRHHRLSEG
jgi:hypothetical protein